MRSFAHKQQDMIELTVRSIILAIFLTIILAAANAYLALKLGILTSASIPAAIISMGILRLFKNASILENNAVQTAASAGEAVAGGIVYTIPALIIIEYWHQFNYLTNFLIAFTGGVLGVLFSIPLRRILVHDNTLKFPEGRAIAEVLKSSQEKTGLRDIVYGGIIGALLELFQSGFKLIASSWNYFFVASRSLFSMGAGFSATMIGAGYLIGFDMACSILCGAVISWIIAIPVASPFFPQFLHHASPTEAAQLLWNQQLRYLGIGAMLFAGFWTFLKLIRPLARNIYTSLSNYSTKQSHQQSIPRVDKDIPLPFIFIGTLVIAIILFVFFNVVFPFDRLNADHFTASISLGAVTYVLVVGFLFAVITAYFSGMVGVTASPGSSIVISGILFASWLLLGVLHTLIPLPLNHDQIIAAETIVIIICSVITGIAAIANDNTQDLKVGQLVGATPWKQQLMLLLGVTVSSLVIPPVMQLLFNVYGIAGVMPHDGMDITQSLPAPTAALLAAIAEAVFNHNLPWSMMLIGAAIIGLVLLCDRLFNLKRFIQLSILGIAIGMYLPITSSVPLFIGGMIALFVKRSIKHLQKDEINERKKIGTRIACGLVAGSALADVLLAIPFSLLNGPDALRLVGKTWESNGLILAVISTLLLAFWIKHRIKINI